MFLKGEGFVTSMLDQVPLLVNVYNSGSLTIRPKTSSSFILAIFFINLKKESNIQIYICFSFHLLFLSQIKNRHTII